jgi:murein DD-endopeptidase MepM/ murein hydrolase activator NlpD
MEKRNPFFQNKLYRLSLVEDTTHKRLRTWRFSRLGGIVAVVTTVVVISLLAWCIIGLTPLRTTIPGYPDAHFKRGAIANALKIDSLENEMTRWVLYAGNLSRILAGEETLAADSLLAGNTRAYLRNLGDAELARQDSLLRSTVNSQEQFGVTDRKRELPLEGLHFFSPLKGTISQAFDGVLHPGTDITAPAGSVVCSVLDGTVILSGWTDDSGYVIAIQHDGGVISICKHNQKLLRKTGESVKAGTPVALVGNTGSLTAGDYLHFELWYNGEAIDPAKYCKFK